MDKEQYKAVKSQLSFDKPAWPTLILLVADMLLLAIALYLLTLETLIAFLVSQILLAIFYFHNFGILHEAVHGNLHKSRRLNTVIAHYASIFCFTPYFPWKFMHQKHHTYAGSLNKDPTMHILEKIKESSKIPLPYSVAWRIWFPLPAAVQHVLFWFYPFRVKREGTNDSAFFKRAIFSSLVIIGAYTTFALFFPNWFTVGNLGLSIFLYFMLTEIINLPHHTNVPVYFSTPELQKLPLWQQHITTRSCRYPGLLSEAIPLNFNLHIEHHYFPNLPWYRLKKVRDIIKPLLGNEYTEVSDFGWNIEKRKQPAPEVILPDVPHPLLDKLQQK